MSDTIEIESADELASYYEAKLKELDYAERIAKIESSDDANHVYRFNDEVDEDSVNKAIETFASWHRNSKKAKWTVWINSPGGLCNEGLALYDELYAYSLRGGGKHHITTKVRGLAASMGSILLQAGDTRIAGRYSQILIHEPSSGMMGSFGQVQDEMVSLKMVREHLMDIYTDRSGMPRYEFDSLWSRRDWWLDSSAALANNFIDKIG